MFCRKCGKETEEGNRFCQFCGTEINSVSAPVVEEKKAAPEKKKKTAKKNGGKKSIIIAVVAVLVIAIAAGAFVLSGGSAPTDSDDVGTVQLRTADFVLYNTDEELYIKYDSGLVKTLATKDDMVCDNGNTVVYNSGIFSYYDAESGYLFYPGKSNEDYTYDLMRMIPDEDKAQEGPVNAVRVATGVKGDDYVVCDNGRKVFYINSTDNKFCCNVDGVDNKISYNVADMFICEESGTYYFADKRNGEYCKLFSFDPETFEYEAAFGYNKVITDDSSFIRNSDYSVMAFYDIGAAWVMYDGTEKVKITDMGENDYFSNEYFQAVDYTYTSQPGDCLYVVIGWQKETPLSELVELDFGQDGTLGGMTEDYLRSLVAKTAVKENLNKIYCIKDKTVTLIAENATDVHVDGDAVVFRKRDDGVKLNFSKVVEKLMKDYNSYLIGDIVAGLEYSAKSLLEDYNRVTVVIEGNIAETEHSRRNMELYYDEANGILYYEIMSEDPMSNYSEWYKCTFKDGKVESTELIGDDIYAFWLGDNGDCFMIKKVRYSDIAEIAYGDLYFNGQLVDSNIVYYYRSCDLYTQSHDGKLYYFKDFDDRSFTGKLTVYDGENKTEIADNVGSFFVRNADEIYYISDYDMSTIKGNLMKYVPDGEDELITADGANIFVP